MVASSCGSVLSKLPGLRWMFFNPHLSKFFPGDRCYFRCSFQRINICTRIAWSKIAVVVPNEVPNSQLYLVCNTERSWTGVVHISWVWGKKQRLLTTRVFVLITLIRHQNPLLQCCCYPAAIPANIFDGFISAIFFLSFSTCFTKSKTKAVNTMPLPLEALQ